MKKNIAALLAGLLAFLVAGPAAAGASVSVGYLVDSSIEVESDFGDGDIEDGDGFSLQGSFDVAESLFLYGDYFTREFEDDFGDTLDWDTLRLGVGYAFEAPIYIGVNFEELEVGVSGDSDSTDGFGARIGTRLPLGEVLYFNGELGVTILDDATAADLAVGLGFQVNQTFSIFADYRVTAYEPDDNPDDLTLTLSDLRLGARVDF